MARKGLSKEKIIETVTWFIEKNGYRVIDKLEAEQKK